MNYTAHQGSYFDEGSHPDLRDQGRERTCWSRGAGKGRRGDEMVPVGNRAGDELAGSPGPTSSSPTIKSWQTLRSLGCRQSLSPG